MDSEQREGEIKITVLKGKEEQVITSPIGYRNTVVC